MSEESKSIVKTLHIDDEGLKSVKVIDINNLMKEGIVDIPAFLNGLLDAENDKEFNESTGDYVKGYKYGKTGTF
jgi:hypothetical protein